MLSEELKQKQLKNAGMLRSCFAMDFGNFTVFRLSDFKMGSLFGKKIVS